MKEGRKPCFPSALLINAAKRYLLPRFLFLPVDAVGSGKWSRALTRANSGDFTLASQSKSNPFIRTVSSRYFWRSGLRRSDYLIPQDADHE